MKFWKILINLSVQIAVSFEIEKSWNLRFVCSKLLYYPPPPQRIICIERSLPPVSKWLAGLPLLESSASMCDCKVPLLEEPLGLPGSLEKIQTTISPPIPLLTSSDTVDRVAYFRASSPRVEDFCIIDNLKTLQTVALLKITSKFKTLHWKYTYTVSPYVIQRNRV